MRTTKLAFLALTAALTMSLAGCGSNRDSGGDQTTGTAGSYGTETATGIKYVGADVCIGCHEGFSWSADAVQNYLEGKHVIHSTHITAASGACLDCHDPIGDGRTLESLIAAVNVPAAGLAAVTCENCHGAGGTHFGVGPIPNAEPDFNACGKCHNEAMEHNAYHPEGDNILEDYVSSPHAASGDRPEAVCARCHTDEGGRLYRNVNTVSSLEAVVMPVANASAIQCRTCHDPHNPNKLLLEAVEDHGTVTASAEFATCTSCHQRPDAQFEFDGTGNPVVTQLDGSTSSDGASGDMIYHATRYTRVIASSHYDNPATSYQSASLNPADPAYAPNVIEGYVVDPTNERACRDCHNVHAADTTINRQWAKSGHGGAILTAKEEANADSHSIAGAVAYRAAGSAAADNAFPHYDWDDTAARGDCQMCHTATGNMNFQKDPAGYAISGINNDFSHLAGWSKDTGSGVVTSSGQNELLYCWSCHQDNSGALRSSGPVTLKSYTFGGNAVTLPDAGNSNICLNCHGGRNNGEIIVATAPADRSSRFAGHHGTAAGSLFSATTHIGYEYPGLQYDSKIKNDGSPTSFKHAGIGTADANGNELYVGTGTTSGPCVSCHMPDSNHEWKVVAVDGAGVGSITSQAVCDACHGSMTYDSLEEEKAGFEQALTLLNAYLTNSIANTLAIDVAANYKTVPVHAYGAYENFKYLDDEPGAFTHNRKYARRLIFDSIDYLDNGTLDGTIVVDMTTYPLGGDWLGASTLGEASRY